MTSGEGKKWGTRNPDATWCSINSPAFLAQPLSLLLLFSEHLGDRCSCWDNRVQVLKVYCVGTLHHHDLQEAQHGRHGGATYALGLKEGQSGAWEQNWPMISWDAGSSLSQR